MIKLNKVWSEENIFKTIDFHPGINFIVGDSSKDKDGVVKNEQRNGSGKSLSIELINFALLKKSSESRICKVPDSILPPESFVYLSLTINNKDIVIGRNKIGKIKIKIGESDFTEVDETTAKNELSNLCLLDKKISFRELCNFIIKESSYNYSTFLSFFVSNYFEKLKPSLYFFDLPIDLFRDIREMQENYEDFFSAKRLVNKKIEERGLDINRLKSLQIDMELRVKELENGLSYEEISKQISESAYGLEQYEEEQNILLREKGRIEFSLNEIDEFVNHTNKDIVIDDKKLKAFFNSYIKGLGDFVQKDFEQLKQFRDEMSIFKSEILLEQKEALEKRLAVIKIQIEEKYNKIQKFQTIISTGKNHLQRAIKFSNDLINDFNETGKMLSDINYYDKSMAETMRDFQNKYSEIQSSFFSAIEKEDSFRKTFLEIHEKIYGNKDAVFSLDLDSKRSIRDKEFFKIRVEIDRQGSEGRNRGRQVIYDLSLLENSFTREKTQGLLVHDRLIFGDMDNDASYKILNHLNSLNQSSFQYIGTLNTDIIESANSHLQFKIKDKEAVNLTIQEPLFYKQFKQAIDYDKEEGDF